MTASGDQPRARNRQAQIAARRRARRMALQALYQWQLNPQDAVEIELQFRAEQEMDKVDVDYFHHLLQGVVEEQDTLDGYIEPYLDRPLAELDPVERAILRLGAYELARRPEVPYVVAINEGVELAKTFGAEQSHRYVNGILDKLAARLRGAEVRARGG